MRGGYAPTLTLANSDLACHKYVQARDTLAPSHFSPRNRRSFGQMCSLDRVPKCGALNHHTKDSDHERSKVP